MSRVSPEKKKIRMFIDKNTGLPNDGPCGAPLLVLTAPAGLFVGSEAYHVPRSAPEHAYPVVFELVDQPQQIVLPDVQGSVRVSERDRLVSGSLPQQSV